MFALLIVHDHTLRKNGTYGLSPFHFSGDAPRLAIIVDDDIDIYDIKDVLYALSIRAHGTDDVEGFNGVRALAEPLTILIKGPKDIEMLPNNRWAIDATKPAFDEPEHRLEWARLRARGEGKVKLADFL